MLLPFDGLSYRVDPAGLIHPRWLGEDDEPFVDAVLETVATFDGLTVHEVELIAEVELPAVARAEQGRRGSSRVAEALWAIERRRWEAEIDAPMSPEAIRAIVFDSAATLPRDEALAQAAFALGLTPSVVMASLFADRHARRRYRAPARRSEAADLVAHYNLSVVQTLLSRAMSITATTSGDPRGLTTAAKRDGLIAQMSARSEDDGHGALELSLVGPLALVHDTAKYGRSIARFVPSLVVAKEWSFRARLDLWTRHVDLALDHESPVMLAGGAPSAPASHLARKTVRALGDQGVRVDLQPPALRAGGTLVVPDFALEWGSARVFVDVLPFATAEHLAAKLEVVNALDESMIVCVDERYLGGATSPVFVPYRRTLDPWLLLNAARAAASRRDAA